MSCGNCCSCKLNKFLEKNKAIFIAVLIVFLISSGFYYLVQINEIKFSKKVANLTWEWFFGDTGVQIISIAATTLLGVVTLKFLSRQTAILEQQTEIQKSQHTLLIEQSRAQDREYKRVLIADVIASFGAMKASINGYIKKEYTKDFWSGWARDPGLLLMNRYKADVDKLRGLISENDISYLYNFVTAAGDLITKLNYEAMPGGHSAAGFSEERWTKLNEQLDPRLQALSVTNLENILFPYIALSR